VTKAAEAQERLMRRAGSFAAAAIVTGLTLALHLGGDHNGDNSWFTTFAEKFLDGSVPYEQVSDPNPPAAFLVYVPGILLGRLLPPETMTAILIILAVFASVLFAVRILVRGGIVGVSGAALARNAGLYALLLLPGICFAEREHFALIAIFPMLATIAVRGSGASVALPEALIAGAAGGLALAFKPFFGLALALPMIAGAWRRRDIRLFVTPENFAAAGVALFYAILARVYFPAYFFGGSAGRQ
jgi:hypothetical protein